MNFISNLKAISETNIYKQWRQAYPKATTVPGYILELAKKEIEKNISIIEQQFNAKYFEILDTETFKKWRTENPKATTVPDFIINLAKSELPPPPPPVTDENKDNKDEGILKNKKYLIIGAVIAGLALVYFATKKK